MTALLAAPFVLRAQDAAVEERLNKLSAQIDVLIEIKDAQNKRIEELAKQLRDLQDQQNKPNASYATTEEIRQLSGKLKEIDEARVQDNERIVKEIEKLGKTLGAGARKTGANATTPPPGEAPREKPPEKGYEHIVKAGESYSVIAQAYTDQGIKVTSTQIQKANPGIDPSKLRIGQKIFIPAPQ